MAPTYTTHTFQFHIGEYQLDAIVGRPTSGGCCSLEFDHLISLVPTTTLISPKDNIRRIVRTTWVGAPGCLTNNQQAYCELAAFVGDQTIFDNVLQSVDKYDRDALQKFIDEQACMVTLPTMYTPMMYTTHTFQFLIGEDKLDAIVSRPTSGGGCSIQFDLRTRLVPTVGSAKANIRSIVARTWVGATRCLTNNQQTYCELAAFVGDQTTFDGVLYSVDKYDRAELQKFIAVHACTVALPTQPTIHTFDFECDCACSNKSKSRIHVEIGLVHKLTYVNHHTTTCPIAQAVLNIIEKKPIRPAHTPTSNDTWMRMVAVIGDQACFDTIENWVVTYDYDMLKDFITQHNLAVKLPARTSYHTFTFDRTGGGPLVEIILGRLNGVTFIHSMKRLCSDAANHTMKCVGEIITGTFIPATYKRQLTNQTWAKIAAFTNNVKTYKSVTEWSPGAIDQDVFDFARKYECDEIVKYMTPHVKEVTCAIGTYTITWQVSKRQDHVTKSAIVTGSLQESDFAIVASILMRATDRTKPVHVALLTSADAISAAYKQIDEFSKA